MSIPLSEFKKQIRSFNYKELFLSLGWDNVRYDNVIKIDNNNYNLTGIVEKHGFIIIICTSTNGFPDVNIRKKIDKQITRHFFEHLLIFHDNNSKQIWQLVRKEPNKPMQVKEITYHNNQEPEQLFQKLKGLLFTLDEEEKISLADVKIRVTGQFNRNAEKVTKKFYAEFKDQHKIFQSFIEGIKDKANKDWYASLMLYRLMFIYFIQKKGFLDNNPNYLSDKLKESVEQKGKNKFCKSFYRNFLLVLFRKGLAKPDHDNKLLKEIGKVPYLNDGLFDEHELEKNNKHLDIKDKAFERLFDFFNEYNWHLDTRIEASGKDINPDVIGYIFEKYINDRASMGAYYTKEDITEYISKNTIIPFLFDKVKKDCANAFKHESSLWLMLKENPGKYIYDAVKHGIYEVSSGETESVRPLPQEIEIGLDITKPNLLERRKEWNKPAPKDYALPNEIWREVVERRQRYFEIKNKIENEVIREIKDFITYNLNIRQFAQDALEQYEGSDFINSFYKAIKEITILDPTCGSGAFLFAALNILEPLYETCIKRMREFVEQADENNLKQKYPAFREVLAGIEKHPNEKYFIYKSIMLNNLYGVDIMKEAVEIAKLRLFLKLLAEVEPDNRKENYGLESLPDIDFNIRPGNTLVGYATASELDKGLNRSSDFENNKTTLYERIDIVAKAFKHYKEIQLEEESFEYAEFRNAKDKLQKRLKDLNDNLNEYLSQDYGIINDSEKTKKWIAAHKPFHWFAEFYQIIHEQGGFDVVIGNPPYLQLSKIEYNLMGNYVKSGDLYGYMILRGTELSSEQGNFGFIVMHSLAFSRNFKEVREFIKKHPSSKWFSFYARIPSGLFTGDVRVRNCIFLLNKSSNSKIPKEVFTTRIHRWFSEQRENLFQLTNYSQFSFQNAIPMFDDSLQSKFFENLKGDQLASYFNKKTGYKLYYKKTAYNWIAATPSPPPSFDEKGKKIRQTQISSLFINDEKIRNFLLLLLNGKLFYSYWLIHGDEFHVTQDLFDSFCCPVNLILEKEEEKILSIFERFDKSLDKTLQFKLNAGKRVGSYNTSKLWRITDLSDKIILKHMADDPDLLFESIQNHVAKTVMTELSED